MDSDGDDCFSESETDMPRMSTSPQRNVFVMDRADMDTEDETIQHETNSDSLEPGLTEATTMETLTNKDIGSMSTNHSTSAYFGTAGFTTSMYSPTSKIRYSTDSIISVDEPIPVTKSFSEAYKEEKGACTKHFDTWSEHEQVDFVTHLLSRMCHHQHGQINSYLKPMLQRDFITALPGRGMPHVAENILTYLDAKSLCAAELVCHTWYRVIQEGMLWKRLIERNVRTDSLWKGLSERMGWCEYNGSFEVKHLYTIP